MLDREPACLAGAGRALSCVHTIKGEGAGLLDTEMASTPRGIHRRWEDYVHLLLDEHLDRCIEAGFVDNPLAEEIRELFQAMRPALANRPMRLLHGDLGIHNIVVDPASKDVTALLDWEDALVGDPLFDIAMVSSFHPERRLPAFLQGYGLAQPNPDERRLVALYFLRIALSKTVHRLRFGVRDLAGRTPGHHRIYRGVSELRQLM
jgi:aminoglycoside phosphotransferase (APT) family kinase protein